MIRHPSDFSHNSGYAELGYAYLPLEKSEVHILATTLVGTNLKVAQDREHSGVRACAEDRGGQVECHIEQLGYVKP